ncbi:MAG: DHH family phosphoesterase [Clostridiales bacterium]|nr:DHH family phosphoesterase [Candidatus Crickella merdequi]
MICEENEFIMNLPIPACVVSADGLVKKANALMSEVILYNGIEGANFFTLTGVKRSEVIENNDEKEILIERNGRFFTLHATIDADSEKDTVIFFDEATGREHYKKLYEGSKPVVILVSIDNYDELLSSITTDSKRAVPAEVDRIVRNWASEYKAPVLSSEEESYVILTDRVTAESIKADNFSVLDEVRQIETKIDFPVSLSIGMGMSDGPLADTHDLAEAARELALGRGGDQAVVKDDEHTYHYGGTLQSMEKNNRGRAKVIAHAIKRVIKESSRVLVMGHRWPDMDSFGSALGAYRMCEFLGKEVYLILEDYNEALEEIYKAADNTEAYRIIKHKKALELMDDKTLVIVVDTNRPSLVECREVLDKAVNKIVIDHHRLADDSIAAPTIAYVESYASSASELVSEVLQHVSQKKIITKFEAEALLAGIMVDTNSYSIRSGVRTFEAAAWLKRSGADTSRVKGFFQTDIMSFQAKANAVATAEYTAKGIAFATTDCYTSDAQIINAQVADELLTVKGVKASFVFGRNDKLKTLVNARSLGGINVQVIMEKLGGGGHLTAAAAQLDISPEEAREEINRILAKLEEEKAEKNDKA